MHTKTHPDGTVITSSNDDVLHGVMQHGENLRARMSLPVMHQVGGCGGANPNIPHTHAPIKPCTLSTYQHSVDHLSTGNSLRNLALVLV